MRTQNVLCIALASSVAGLAHGQASLLLLSDLPGGNTDARVVGASGDMSRVVGFATGPVRSEATYWDVPSGSRVSMGLSPTGDVTRFFGANGDGSVLVGTSTYQMAVDVRLTRWTQATGLVEISNPTGITGNRFVADPSISRDGSTITYTDRTGGINVAYRYSDVSGHQVLPSLSGNYARVTDTSSDGSVSIGMSRHGDGRYQAIRWNGFTQQLLSDPTSIDEAGISEALATTAVGSIAVGYVSDSATGISHAAKWDANGVGILLGTFPHAGSLTVARAVTPDGSVIVGDTNTGAEENHIAWIHRNGAFISVADALIEAGYALDPTLRFATARGVSDDGFTITGTAILANGDHVPYVVTIPAPSAALLFGAGLFATSRRRR